MFIRSLLGATSVALMLFGAGACSPAAADDKLGPLDDHFLASDDYCVSDQPLDERPWGNRSSVVSINRCVMARMTKPPDADGVAGFKVIHSSQRFWSKHYWRTHQARPGEIKAGMLVAYVYGSLPTTREQALQANWDLYRVVSPARGDRFDYAESDLPVANARIVDGDAVKPIEIRGKPDRHGIPPEYWLVAVEEPISTDPLVFDAVLGLPLRAPSRPGEEGEFLTRGGFRVTTRLAVRTRAAKAAELKIGARLAMTPTRDLEEDGPTSFIEALRAEWLIGPLTRTQYDYYWITDAGRAKAGAARMVVR